MRSFAPPPRPSRLRLHWFDDMGMADDLRKSLYWVIFAVTAGMFGNVVTSGSAWSGFQRTVLGANDFQLGLIAAIPVALNVAQIFISFYMERKRNRRFLFLFFGIVGRFFWIPIALVPYIFPGFSVDLRIWLVIVFVAFVSIGNSFVNLGFGSLMGDLVPMRIRGQYFGVRQRVMLAAGAICGIVVAIMIDTLGDIGYTIALALAGVTTIMDIVCFFFFKWPDMAEPEGGVDRTPIRVMLKEVFVNKPFMKVTLFFTLWQFAVGISNPFFNVFMLEELNMNFIQMILYTQIASNVVTVLTVSRWGRLIDRYGNKTVMQLVILINCLSPIPWLLATPKAIWFVLLSNVISGCFWPVMDLAQQNMYLNQSPRMHRSMYVAVFFACINLTGIALGNAVGGWLMQNAFKQLEMLRFSLFGVNWTNTHYIILLGMLLRLLVALLILPRISEQGTWNARAAARDLYVEKAAALKRRRFMFRAYFMRRRARRSNQEGAQEKQ